MLSWSSTESGSPADLAAIAVGEGDAGLPHGAELVAFAEAIARFDDGVLAVARDRLVECAGEAFMVDAAAVAANFEMMTRVADGTGARHATERAASMTPMIGRLGIDGFTSHR
jgi:hypothetical protein